MNVKQIIKLKIYSTCFPNPSSFPHRIPLLPVLYILLSVYLPHHSASIYKLPLYSCVHVLVYPFKLLHK